MKVDALGLDLRPRSMVEAADLGVRIASANARSVWASTAPVHAGVALLALSSLALGGVWPFAVLFWLKPWLDRSILFALSRAVFGEPTRFADLWAASRTVWWTELVHTLTVRRLSPWRSFVQPVLQLEGQRGAPRRTRIAVILGPHRGSAFGTQFAFSWIESALVVGAMMLATWFLPVAERSNAFLELASVGTTATATAALAFVIYAGVVFFVEPFFVGAGFAMYLNRRVELEAWDIEQEFRVAFAT